MLEGTQEAACKSPVRGQAQEEREEELDVLERGRGEIMQMQDTGGIGRRRGTDVSHLERHTTSCSDTSHSSSASISPKLKKGWKGATLKVLTTQEGNKGLEDSPPFRPDTFRQDTAVDGSGDGWSRMVTLAEMDRMNTNWTFGDDSLVDSADGGAKASPRLQSAPQRGLVSKLLLGQVQTVVKEAARMHVEFEMQAECDMLLSMQFFTVLVGSSDEALLLKSLGAVMRVLRSDSRQRALVRRNLFRDPNAPDADPRKLAYSIEQWLGLATLPHPDFLAATIELLALFLVPKSELHQRSTECGGSNLLVDDEQDQELDAEPRPRELSYCIKQCVETVLDRALGHPELGAEPFFRLQPATKTFVWGLELYLLLVRKSDTVALHAAAQFRVRTAWETVSRKISSREKEPKLAHQAKVAALGLLVELGKLTSETPAALLTPASIGMINMNRRSSKELTKMLHMQRSLHPLVLRVMSLICLKPSNAIFLKREGMMEYVATRILPLHMGPKADGPARRGGEVGVDAQVIPEIVVLLNVWATAERD
eukprot:Hpha_TRINITY_DN15864_c4_g4::TRINITY_DN15864_c4_g4_i1::g.192079::m.192079